MHFLRNDSQSMEERRCKQRVELKTGHVTIFRSARKQIKIMFSQVQMHITNSWIKFMYIKYLNRNSQFCNNQFYEYRLDLIKSDHVTRIILERKLTLQQKKNVRIKC